MNHWLASIAGSTILALNLSCFGLQAHIVEDTTIGDTSLVMCYRYTPLLRFVLLLELVILI